MIDKKRQILFKIIQMDPGSESLLGWCKTHAKNRLQNEYSGDERVGFRSAGNIGDISYNVKTEGAQGGDIFVRIMLSLDADISAYFGYALAVEMRCRCRGVVLAKTAATNQRSAVFMTDGSELASATITFPINGNYPSPIFMTAAEEGVGDWHGGSSAAMFVPFEFSPGSIRYDRSTDITFEVPADACFTERPAPPFPSAGPGTEQWAIDWVAGQAKGLERENARRKTCSDGMYTHLRNGFLPPEFEYFIKTTAPKSALLRRKIPMTIVSRSQTLDSDVTDANNKRVRVWTAKVKLHYDSVETDGSVTPHEQEFTGTVTQETTIHKDDTLTPIQTTDLYTYVSLPLLVDGTLGKAYPQASPLPVLPFSAQLKIKTTAPLFHDDATFPLLGATFPLLVEANGTFNNNTSWRTNDTYFEAAYTPTVSGVNITDLTPVPQPTRDNVVFTHPQFLLDYIKASKPTEAKTPDVPSTDWLSSRLADNEIIAVIPLSFILPDGTDRGMYPFSIIDEVPAQYKVTGFAKVRFDYSTATFNEPVWTEFDVPAFFTYNESWEDRNCVCIGSKNQWTDTKNAARTQSKHIGDSPPSEYVLTDEEKLYREVKKALAQSN